MSDRINGRFARNFRRVLVSLLATAIAGASPLAAVSAGSAQAQMQRVKFHPGHKTSQVRVPVGKSENIRTNTSFLDIVVGDPEVADVMPLTDRTLSVLGRKIGLTRISVYGEGKVLVGVFDIEVSHDTQQIAAAIRAQFPEAKVRVSTVNGRILLAGLVTDGIMLDRIMTFAKQFSPDVINSMSVAAPQQVMLEVRFVEASRNAGRELGVRWDVVGNNIAATAGTAGLLSGSTPFGVAIGTLLNKGVRVDAMIQALEDRGVARRLAEPNLVALSGDTASFLAGGEFPFPVAAQNNQITIQFKKFGVGLAFTPTVLSGGLINLKIEPEVSQLDPTNTVQVGNVSIPSIIVRRATTTIELRDGQSFAIAGLLQSNTTTAAAQLPWIADVPVLGTLFRSAQYQKKETDLVIIVTPRLVQPARPGDRLRTPLEATVPPNDNDLFVNGRMEVTPADIRKMYGPVAQRPQVGHMLDLPEVPNGAQ
ncbi:MAG: type II and III secretion system protein family protein [Xanthobacteraceae bacterium]|nr:type II and III secretion system protein family protein [Xanthobacteraceae bacterium]QYK45212.1 MAG: type II and III secretion system protein family protein [Xanthobacteraceae bacterium]